MKGIKEMAENELKTTDKAKNTKNSNKKNVAGFIGGVVLTTVAIFGGKAVINAVQDGNTIYIYQPVRDTEATLQDGTKFTINVAEGKQAYVEKNNISDETFTGWYTNSDAIEGLVGIIEVPKEDFEVVGMVDKGKLKKCNIFYKIR